MKLRLKILLTCLLVFAGIDILYGQGLPKACGGTEEGYRIRGMWGSTFQWTAEGGTVQRVDIDSTNPASYVGVAYILWDRNPGNTHTLSVVEQTMYNCIGPVNIDTVTVEVPTFAIEERDQIICAVDTPFTYHATPGFGQYFWDNDTVSTPNSFYFTHANGMHTVLSHVYIDTRVGDSVRCTVSDTTYLVVHPMPVVNLGNDTVICFDEQLELVGGIPDSMYTYNWSTGEISESIMIREGEGDYWVKATSQKGCVTYDTIHIYPCKRSYLLGNIPNTFTPGSDGTNDTWIIEKLEGYPEAKVEIYDRSGRMVWNSDKGASKKNTVNWDGTDLSGRELPMGAYFYIIKLNRPGVEPITGHINLVR